MNQQIFKISAVLCTLIAVSACNQSKPMKPKKPVNEGAVAINQDTFCVAWDLDPVMIKKFCSVGQKVLFTPMQWGNEQFPVRFAARNCDFRYSVVMTTGAVSCIYKPAEVKVPTDFATKP